LISLSAETRALGHSGRALKYNTQAIKTNRTEQNVIFISTLALTAPHW